MVQPLRAATGCEVVQAREPGRQLLWAQTVDPLTKEKFDATRMNN